MAGTLSRWCVKGVNHVFDETAAMSGTEAAVRKVGERHVWGSNVSTEVTHGTVLRCAAAKEDLAFGFELWECTTASHSRVEDEEGVSSTIHTHALLYRGENLWTLSTADHRTDQGAWGTSSAVFIDEEKDELVLALTLRGTCKGGGGGRDANEERRYKLHALLRCAAA